MEQKPSWEITAWEKWRLDARAWSLLDVARRRLVVGLPTFRDNVGTMCLIFADGTDLLSRNVGNQLQIYAAQYPTRVKTSNYYFLDYSRSYLHFVQTKGTLPISCVFKVPFYIILQCRLFVRRSAVLSRLELRASSCPEPPDRFWGPVALEVEVCFSGMWRLLTGCWCTKLWRGQMV